MSGFFDLLSFFYAWKSSEDAGIPLCGCADVQPVLKGRVEVNKC